MVANEQQLQAQPLASSIYRLLAAVISIQPDCHLTLQGPRLKPTRVKVSLLSSPWACCHFGL